MTQSSIDAQRQSAEPRRHQFHVADGLEKNESHLNLVKRRSSLSNMSDQPSLGGGHQKHDQSIQ